MLNTMINMDSKWLDLLKSKANFDVNKQLRWAT